MAHRWAIVCIDVDKVGDIIEHTAEVMEPFNDYLPADQIYIDDEGNESDLNPSGQWDYWNVQAYDSAFILHDGHTTNIAPPLAAVDWDATIIERGLVPWSVLTTTGEWISKGEDDNPDWADKFRELMARYQDAIGVWVNYHV